MVTEVQVHSIKSLLALLNIAKFIKTQESLRNCHSQVEPKETGRLHVMWVPGWHPRTEKAF